MKKIAIVLILSTIILTFFVGCNGKTTVIDVKDIADIQIQGLNTKGKISVVEQDKDSVNLIVNEYTAISKDTLKINDFIRALNSIQYRIMSEKLSLSNGDEVIIKVIYDEELINQAKIKIENEEFTYIVSGLEEATPLDLFAEIEIVYEGVSPEAKVEVYNRSEKQFIRDISYEVEPSYNLRVGDKIVVTAQLDTADAESNGFLVPDSLTKEFTVENIDEYVKDFNEIDQATKDKMKKESLDRVESDCASEYGNIIGFDTLNLWSASGDKFKKTKFDIPELTNIYFNTIKQGVSGNSNNNIFYVYKVTAHYDPEPEPRIAYAAVQFKDAIKKVDSSIYVDFGRAALVSTGTEFEHVYRDVVTAQKKSYEIQEIAP